MLGGLPRGRQGQANKRCRTNADRLRQVDELDAIIGAFVAQHTQAQNMAFFERAELTIWPIYDVTQILEDPHVIERELLAEYPDPEMSSFPMHHVVPRLAGTPGSIRTAAPRLGEHNRALLAEAGIDDKAYAALLAAGAPCESRDAHVSGPKSEGLHSSIFMESRATTGAVASAIMVPMAGARAP